MVDPAPPPRQSRSWSNLLSLLVRIILWPLLRLLNLLFPPHGFDGISPAVASKAAQAFTSYLTTVVPESAGTLDCWSTMGFAACKNEAIHSNALLLLYLHAPLHRDADQVAQVLCRPPIIEFLEDAHVVPLGVSIHSGQGAQLSQLLDAAAFPLLAVLKPGPSRSNNLLELVVKIQGPALVAMSVNALAGHLQATLQRHAQGLVEQESRRLLREQENELRAQQDAEYQEGLRADQERQRAAQEESERLAKEEQERLSAEQREQEEKTNRLQKARDLVQPEPAPGQGPIAQIRFALPSGRKIVRKFSATEKVAVLRAFLTVYFHDNGMGEMPNIGLSTSFPRRLYNDREEYDMTLQEADLSPQAVLMVQDLDA